jgi:hypothetical protein
MSYGISISGHKTTSGEDESKAFEEETLAKAREFVASLEGVSAASGSFGSLGTVNLMSAE